MKNLFVIISATTVLAMTATAMHASSRGDYDVRPENKVPRMERPAWPDYDLHNQNSFAVFADVQTAPENEGVRLRWESERVSSGRITLCRCREATYVTYDWTVPAYQDWWFFRWTEGSMMIDADTGDRYMLRRLEHFPMNQCFWIHGQSGETNTHRERLSASAAVGEAHSVFRSRRRIAPVDERSGQAFPDLRRGVAPSK